MVGLICSMLLQAFHLQDVQPSLSESMHAVHAFSAQAVGSCVVTVAFHPAAPDVFLVAYGMSYLAVYVAHRRCAVSVLSCPSEVLAAVWLPARRDQCAAVTTCGHISVLDVTSGALKAHEDFKLKLPEGVECTSAVASTWSAGRGGARTGKENTTTQEATGGGLEQDVLVIGLSTGACLYHVLGRDQQTSTTVTWSGDMLVANLLGAV